MKRIILLFASLGLIISGCSTYNYYSLKSDHVDFSKYQTYAWLPAGDAKVNKVFDNTIAEEKIVDASNQALNERGLKLDNRKPDLLIKYTALVDAKTRTVNDPVYYNSPSYYVPRMSYFNGRRIYYYQYVNPFPVYVGSEMRREKYDEANVMIDLIDRKTSKVIWRGWGKGELNDPEKAVNNLPKVVDKIFNKLPAS